MSDDGQARFPGKLPGKGTRNGLPEFRPYRWRPADAAREARVKALLEGIRAHLTEEEEGLLGDSFDDPPQRAEPGPMWRAYGRTGCGTSAAYRRHLRHGEKPCEACTDAQRADRDARNQATRAARETA